MNYVPNIFHSRLIALLSVLLLWGWGGSVYGAEPAAPKTFTLVIDAGHGGRDAGALGKSGKEKTINLNVALALGKLFEQNCPEVKVVYTRKTDVFVSLQERANIANKAKADLFVSIHTNAVASNKTGVSGAETYTLGMHRAAENLEVAKRENSVITYESNYQKQYQGFDPNKAESYIIFELMQDRYMSESIKLAKSIQQQYSNAGRRNKGVHQAGFLVLRETSMPSVLTELGFISHPTEERYLTSQAGVSELASCLYRGIQSYRKRLTADEPTLSGEPPTAQPPMLADNGSSNGGDAQHGPPSVRPVPTTPYDSGIDVPVGEPQPQMPDLAAVARQGMEAAPRKGSRDRLPPLASELNLPPEKEMPEARAKTPTEQKGTPESLSPEDAPVVPEPAMNPERKSVEEPAMNPEGLPAMAASVPEHEMTGIPQPPQAEAEEHDDGRPVFKIQLLTSDRLLKASDPRLKGLEAKYYTDKGLYKYTYGETTDYKEILRMKRQISDRFKDTFIVAFINGRRTDLSQAIKSSSRK